MAKTKSKDFSIRLPADHFQWGEIVTLERFGDRINSTIEDDYAAGLNMSPHDARLVASLLNSLADAIEDDVLGLNDDE